LYQTKQLNIKTMTILEQIEILKSQKSSVRTNREFDNIEKKIMKLAKEHNAQNHYYIFFIHDGSVYGLVDNPNY